MSRLLVIVSDSLRALVDKGEMTPRYYNPGNIFREVHILATNGDTVSDTEMQETVGDARVTLHFLPLPEVKATLGRHPLCMGGWIKQGLKLVREIRPQLVRCYGDHHNAFLAHSIRRTMGVPYVISLHTMPDIQPVPWRVRLAPWLRSRAIECWRKRWLREAHRVLVVYQGICPYLDRLGVRNYRVAYNSVNHVLAEKNDYRASLPFRVLCVGRQTWGKNPAPIVAAMAELPDVQLTLVGDGPHHAMLRELAVASRAADRVVFQPAIPNSQLCARFPEFDAFAAYSEFMEIPKSVIEPLLAGLPVVVNRRHGRPVPEYTDAPVQLVDGSIASYVAAIRELRDDEARRQALGESGRAFALQRWHPKVTEAAYAAAHEEALGADAAEGQSARRGLLGTGRGRF